jgi:hypothetical protein
VHLALEAPPLEVRLVEEPQLAEEPLEQLVEPRPLEEPLEQPVEPTLEQPVEATLPLEQPLEEPRRQEVIHLRRSHWNYYWYMH